MKMACRRQWFLVPSLVALAVLGLENPSFADSTLVFNEIMYHPARNEDAAEWLELHSQLAVDLDISGWSIRGGIDFIFPEGTIVPGGGFIVVAASPSDMDAASPSTDVLGPFARRLSNDGERLELRNNNDRLMDWVEYDDAGVWPSGADGAGVSLAKLDPDSASPFWQNWSTSAEMGGTVGRHNFAIRVDPNAVSERAVERHYDTVVSALKISEVAPSSDSTFWLELVNSGDVRLDLDGFVLARAGVADREHTISDIAIQAGEYLILTGRDLGFGVDSGYKLFLFAPERAALIDAVAVTDSPQARHASMAGAWFVPSHLTPGVSNAVELNSTIVINEIMYHQRPISALGPAGNSAGSIERPFDDQYPYRESPEAWIELYNMGVDAVDLTGWRLSDAVEYEFVPGTTLGPGEYLVVAKDQALTQALHLDVRVVGQFDRELSFKTDHIVLLDRRGNTVDSVRYYDDGYWQAFADGGGSSLELRDPRADNRRPEAWAPSDESTRSSWTTYSYRGVAASVVPGEPADPPELHMGFLAGAGEILVDDVSVIRDPDGAAIELIPNGRFENGSASEWTFGGNHRHSNVIVDPDDSDNYALRLVALGPSEYFFNRAGTSLTAAALDGVEYEITFRAKWLAGSNQLNTRLHFNRLPKTTFIEVPERSGTPGARNSRYSANIGPTFEGLKHRPVVPNPGQPVTVSTVAADPEGVTSVTLWWSTNEGAWHSTAMIVQPDGRYSAQIPGQDPAVIVQFYVEAHDAVGATGFGPPAGPNARALFVVDDSQAVNGPVYNFRMIMLPSEAALMHSRANANSNERIGGTAVWKDRHPYYDVGIRLRGSMGSGRYSPGAGHNIQFQPDHLFRGIHSTVSTDRSTRTGLGLKEIVLLHAFTKAGGLPGMYNDIVQAIGPEPAYTGPAILRMAGQGDVFLDSQYEDGGAGTVFESSVLRTGDTTYVEFMDLGADKEFYRWNFAIKNNRVKDDYAGLIALAKTLDMPRGEALDTRAAEVMDVSEWMRVFAMQALGGVADTYLQDGNHNIRVYTRPSDGRVLAFPWDMDGAFDYSPFPWGQGNLTKVIERTPFSRIYYGHLHDIVTTTYNDLYMSYWTEHYGELAGEDFSGVLAFIAERGRVTREILPPAVPFAAANSAVSVFSDDSVLIDLEGLAWINVEEIRLQGRDQALDVTWTSLQDWRVTVPLAEAGDEIVLTAHNYRGQVVGHATVNVIPSSDGLTSFR